MDGGGGGRANPNRGSGWSVAHWTMGDAGELPWPEQYTDPIEDRPTLARAARRWFEPLPPALAPVPETRPAPVAGTRPGTGRAPSADLPQQDPADLLLVLRSAVIDLDGSGGEPLTIRDFAALRLLHTAGPLRPVDLGTTLGLDKSTASRLIRALVDAGHAARSAHPTDRRASLVELTPAGAAVLAAADERIARATADT